jgi:hypothetical protein
MQTDDATQRKYYSTCGYTLTKKRPRIQRRLRKLKGNSVRVCLNTQFTIRADIFAITILC